MFIGEPTLTATHFFLRLLGLKPRSVTPLLLVFPFMLSGQSAYNPNVLPLGNKEALMGNTGTGGVRSTGAVYYNPAALTMVEGTSFSLSGSVYTSFRFEGKSIATIADTNLDYEGGGFSTIPTSAISVKHWGNWYLGLSFLVPMEFHFEGQQSWNIPVGIQTLDLKLLQNYREKIFLGGVTVARSLGKGWSAGITVFGQTYSYLSTIDFRGTIVEDPGLLIQATQRESRAPADLLLIGGLQRRWEKWNLGLRIAAPSIYLFGKGEYYSFSFSNIEGPGTGSQSIIDITEVRSKFRTPLDVRLGLVHQASSKWQLALDVAYRFPIRYTVYEDNRLEETEGLRGNFRVNSGFEYRLKEKMALYGGASYTPTTLRETGEEAGLDFFSLFAGGKLFTQFIETNIGLFYSRGKGESRIGIGEVDSSQLYEYIGLILGTNYRF